jgi:hypothetical protein
MFEPVRVVQPFPQTTFNVQAYWKCSPDGHPVSGRLSLRDVESDASIGGTIGVGPISTGDRVYIENTITETVDCEDGGLRHKITATVIWRTDRRLSPGPITFPETPDDYVTIPDEVVGRDTVVLYTGCCCGAEN